MRIELNLVLMDSTCLKAAIHFPPDWVLLRAAARTLIESDHAHPPPRHLRAHGVARELPRADEQAVHGPGRGRAHTREQMRVVRECLAHAEASHHGKGNVIHDAGIGRAAESVGAPRFAPILRRGCDEKIRCFQPLSKPDDGLTIRASHRGIAALQQDEGGGEDDDALFDKPVECNRRAGMPLVALVPRARGGRRCRERPRSPRTRLMLVVAGSNVVLTGLVAFSEHVENPAQRRSIRRGLDNAWLKFHLALFR